VQRTAELHHQVADALLPQAEPVFDNATTLDTAVDMLDPQPPLAQCLIRHVLLPREFLATGFLGGHEDLHLGQREGQEAQILQQATSHWQGIRRRLGNALLMDTAAVGVVQKEDGERSVNQQDI
jgi:hypothetical protein